MKKSIIIPSLLVGVFTAIWLNIGIWKIALSQPTIDDPPKNEKIDTIKVPPQQQRSINIKDLDRLNRLFDSVLIKQDTLIKKK